VVEAKSKSDVAVLEAKTAKEAAAKAQEEADKLEAGVMIERSWKKTAKPVKWMLTGAGTVITVLFGGLCILGTWYASDIQDKVKNLISLQAEIKEELKPAVKKVEATNAEVQKNQEALQKSQQAMWRSQQVTNEKLDRVLLLGSPAPTSSASPGSHN
jgi:FtsZ-binding cell division protein ZapB